MKTILIAIILLSLPNFAFGEDNPQEPKAHELGQIKEPLGTEIVIPEGYWVLQENITDSLLEMGISEAQFRKQQDKRTQFWHCIIRKNDNKKRVVKDCMTFAFGGK